jgi:hypothetical protein
MGTAISGSQVGRKRLSGYSAPLGVNSTTKLAADGVTNGHGSVNPSGNQDSWYPDRH